MTGAVVWFTGLPASGKTTLAKKLRGDLTAAGTACCLLDSDQLRELLPALGYDQQGRRQFYETLAGLAALLADQGLVCLVAATAPLQVYRDRARELCPRFVAVYVDTPLETCRQRDPKRLYASADQGQVTELPGVGAPFEPPLAPDVTIRDYSDPAKRELLARIAAARA
ncbi:MAG: hypothetical protein Tsb0020_55890 [Haliangiales bacterium]